MPNEKPIPKIAVLMGDAGGIGPEIAAACIARNATLQHGFPIVVGDVRVLEHAMSVAGSNFRFNVFGNAKDIVITDTPAVIDTKTSSYEKIVPGHCAVEYGLESAQNIETATELLKGGIVDGLAFAPNNKSSMKKAGFKFNGAIDLIAGFLGYDGPACELGVLGEWWTSRISSHIPFREICSKITEENILSTTRILHDAMTLAGFVKPRIAIAAVNPHAGENGTCGSEEREIIEPAVRQALQNGMNVCGPFPADTLFVKLFNGEFNGVVTMYHDQSQIAMKLKGFDDGVTVMGGFPYPVTTCSHGTASDIAGRGTANSGAFENAFRIACEMAAAGKLREARFCR